MEGEEGKEEENGDGEKKDNEESDRGVNKGEGETEDMKKENKNGE